ncbi:DUF5131 family protein [Campylobacter sp. 19-13652]|uniref:DUF5131 family protein n=1 Tax=Campylobacter sp. 19-13652 TaxID=2840180 RepID=UPI001C7636A9|nr:DUF5131 family protein [Campylobacter sp. 19-13652]BCX79075.1 hypothetical protein LBC_05370 [Campylobacter sp. 19-13652]
MQKAKDLPYKFANFSPSIGCVPISLGCAHCYARTIALRLKKRGNAEYKDGFSYKELWHRLEQPLLVKRPTIFFMSAMSDLFFESASEGFLDALFDVIRRTPHHQYQLLTKRPERMQQYFSTHKAPLNLWLGVTVEVATSKWRMEILRQIECAMRWICCEPLLSSLGDLNLNGIDWVVAGAESGYGARACEPEWMLEIKRQCDAQGVAFYFRGWGDSGADKKPKARLLEPIDEFRFYPFFKDATSLF